MIILVIVGFSFSVINYDNNKYYNNHHLFVYAINIDIIIGSRFKFCKKFQFHGKKEIFNKLNFII